jgi:hypothetical protein
MVIACGGVTMIRAGRQVRIEESIEGTLEHDSRPPVLFLRPFASERAPFVQGPLSRYGQYATQGPRWVTKLRTSPDESPNDVISALRAGSWRELADTVGKLGLDLGDDPGPGAVITFDADAKAIVLATGAEAPIEFIQPVHAHLINTFGMDVGQLGEAMGRLDTAAAQVRSFHPRGPAPS